MIVPVILSGGSGTRLWPLSRKFYPKQFLDLVNDTTLFQDTILRLPKLLEKPLIICNEEHRFLAAEQLRQIKTEPNGIILEPVGKNTAPAIALAALRLLNKNNDPLLLVLSADHLIQNNKAFHEAISVAEKLANDDKLVTFGVVANKAETAYGLSGLGDLYVSSAGGRNSKMGSYLGKGFTFQIAKKRFMPKDTVEGEQLSREIAPFILKKINRSKIPLMINLLKTILSNKKLKIKV